MNADDFIDYGAEGDFNEQQEIAPAEETAHTDAPIEPLFVRPAPEPQEGEPRIRPGARFQISLAGRHYLAAEIAIAAGGSLEGEFQFADFTARGRVVELLQIPWAIVEVVEITKGKQ